MRVSSILSLSSQAIVGCWAQSTDVLDIGAVTNLTTGLGNATVIENNPVGKVAIATLPENAFFTAGSLEGNVKGFVKVSSSVNGIGVIYNVSFSNLPKEGGPFTYHIHDKPVPENGNCTATAAHLDPFVRGEDPPCESGFQQTCQVGDLSGKYGKITQDPFSVTFHDEFGSMNTDNNASIVDRSFVIHFSNKTRISCANFVVDSAAATTPDATANAGSGPSSTTSLPASVTGNAASGLRLGALDGVVAVPLIAALFMV